MPLRNLAIASILACIAEAAGAETFDLRGFVTGGGGYSTGHATWLRGGFGRFDHGGLAPDQGKGDPFAGIQLGVDWQPIPHILLHAHGLARAEPSDFHGRRAGLVSAYVEADFDRGRNDFRFRVGQFFLGTSRENTGDLWSSPYTITDSALNTWIGQEVRPVGVNGEWHLLTSTALITTAVTAFRGNDSMGALLAWRGWTIGNRLSVYDEVLPLPPLRSLQTNFTKQRRDGTVPFESDLDGRTGYSARVRYAIPERFNIQFTRLDNRGDRQLHRGEYAWQTQCNDIGAEAHFSDTTLLAEWMGGSTTMGPTIGGVNAGFYAAYVLASQHSGRNRFSARYDLFETQDQRPFHRGEYDEHGRAWTLAWLFDIRPHWRVGTEFTQVVGTHNEAEDAGFSRVIDGRSYTVEVRYSVK